ncbi:MAG: EF-hand domain-containing protein [Gammaproteobacteria bacterium]|nr:EF-hand domain-containing protein [Gammaproteobacteria bacterium]
MQGMSRGNLLNFIISAGYAVLAGILVVVGHSENVPALHGAAAAVLVVGAMLAWFGSHKRLRVIADTPTSLLRSATQGYVELIGECRPIPGAGLLSYGRIPPCLWYAVLVSERKRGVSRNRTEVKLERSDDTFLLDDGTGECVIDPDRAEVLSAHAVSWRVGDVSYRARYLLPGDRLYAIGEMRTLRAADSLDRKGDLALLLREWKTDRAALLARFDADGDGEIDMQEWQQAVGAAEREVDSRHRETRLLPGYHIMSAPRHGRPYLLSNRDPDALVLRYRLWSWFHLAVFVAAAVWGLVMLTGATIG